MWGRFAFIGVSHSPISMPASPEFLATRMLTHTVFVVANLLVFNRHITPALTVRSGSLKVGQRRTFGDC